MQKTILMTGATDGIGLEAAKRLAGAGHTLLLHGRNPAKLRSVAERLSALPGETYEADLSRMDQVEALAEAVSARHEHLDVLVNNAGILRAPETITPEGLDIRFAVNTLAPYLLTRRLLPLMAASGRVINLSSAAQAPVDLEALAGRRKLADLEAYSQSKLALTMWSRHLALALGEQDPAIVAVNPGSLLGTKMVKEGFGVAGGDIGKGAEILLRSALSEDFATASGRYFDNDAGDFGRPHPDALDPDKCAALVGALDELLVGRAA